MSREKEIYFEHADRKRLDIDRVSLVDARGDETVFLAEHHGNPAPDPDEAGVRRRDCLDCHNRPTHVYLSPEEALDEKLMSGAVPRELPFVKKKAMGLIQREYATQAASVEQITRDLRAWYEANYPEQFTRDPSLLERAIDGVTQAYRENVFPEMRIGFGTYERHLGHTHGEVISQDCELCHVVLGVEEPVAEATTAVLNIRP